EPAAFPSALPLPLVGRVGARSAPGWGTMLFRLRRPHPQPLPTRGRGVHHRCRSSFNLRGSTSSWIAVILFGLLVIAAPALAAGQQTLEIATKTVVHVFAVEVADNDAERAKGLMYRKELPEGQGMRFDFH